MENQPAHAITRSHNNPLPRHHVGGGREDCWSEGATETLVEAWGDRYLLLNRGNLRQKDWKEVADTVNDRQDGLKPRKSDVQCKNRIDTLKKKYKVEKTKLPPSQWPFFSRLDYLIGTNATTTASKKTPMLSHQMPTTVKFTDKPSKPKLSLSPSLNPNPSAAVYSAGSSSKSRRNSVGSTESSLGGGGRDDDDDDVDDEDVLFDGGQRRHRINSVDISDRAAHRELARAILKFGEIYERVESSKQQQMMELERQRMEFSKDLEIQRMNMFMEAQLDLQKLKRPNFAPGTGKKL